MPDYLTSADFVAKIKRDHWGLRKFWKISMRSGELKALVTAIEQYSSAPTLQSLREVKTRLDAWKKENKNEFADRGRSFETDLRTQLQEAGLFAEQRVKILRDASQLTPEITNRIGQMQAQQLQGAPPNIVAPAQGAPKVETAIFTMLGKSPTARKLFDAVNTNAQNKDILIVAVQGNGTGFAHQEAFGDPACTESYIAWEVDTPFNPGATSIQDAYSSALRPQANSCVRRCADLPVLKGATKCSIHVDASTQIADDYPAMISLFHELGHAFQSVCAHNKYVAAGHGYTLDVMNITYFERPMLRELGSRENRLYRLRAGYEGEWFGAYNVALGQATAWNYNLLHNAATLTSLRDSLRTDAVYDPKTRDGPMMELTPANDYAP